MKWLINIFLLIFRIQNATKNLLLLQCFIFSVNNFKGCKNALIFKVSYYSKRSINSDGILRCLKFISLNLKKIQLKSQATLYN